MFRKNIQPDCAYCRRGYLMNNQEHCVCKKYGLVLRRSKCRAFQYDPLLRQPSVKPELPFDELEFPDECP